MTTPAEENLLRGQAQVLRARAEAVRVQIDGLRLATEGMSKENRALAQEVDLYASALEQVLLEKHRLKEENADLRIQLQAAQLALASSEARHDRRIP